MSNVSTLNAALAILSAHGVAVERVPGWETRDGSRTRGLNPEAVVVHHTGDESTPLSMIRDGRSNLPGPLANFLVGQSGRVYLVAAGYSNNAGYGGEANFLIAKAGKASAEMKPPASDGSWSANSHAWSIEADGTGNWPAVVRQHVVEVCAALHMAEGWTNGARVIAHKELTRRKPGDPGDDMGSVRADVLAKIAEWSGQTEPTPTPTPDPTPAGDPMSLIRVGYTNLAQLTDWDKRLPVVIAAFNKDIRASVYLLVETDYAMAAALAAAFGWGTPGRPCWRTDENRNTVLWDPSKWYDTEGHQISLSTKPGDLADRHFRSVCWQQLEHKATGLRAWFGASHLSNGDAAAERSAQARVLVSNLPTGAPLLLGIDRNSLEGSDPAKILAARGLPLLTPDLGDTFIGNGIQSGTGAIDGLHGTVPLRYVQTFANAKATDHKIIRAGVDLAIPTT